ncbi:uncharacterized protein LOC124354377 [Homalodisca vitripennis]|uniref:uncharacterized protein LOC124354377 n=1 Tax=Homalodisca vitripennis TaxID=197043 RepID=UPI001EECD8FD|nr:uncharacterized protein LOC124354377 [Homalodisca vitripennis]KAG8252790.1 hypothetical protein J6590_048289 [Homalodisca vitripennis]
MHSMGLHSALAIKRQRKRREEQKKARDRRFSSQSTESGLGESRSSCASPRNSIGSLDHRPLKSRKGYKKPKTAPPTQDKMVSSVGMLHIGVVFLVLGTFLIGSGLIPDDMEHWQKPPGDSYFNEIVFAGIFAFCIGIFLIVLNAVLGKKEDDDLTAYVERQLNRSRSGHRLVRDVETGNLTTKHEQRAKEVERISPLNTDLEDITPIHFSPTLRSPPPLSASTPRSDLERILEEELSEKGEEDNRMMERFNKETLSNNSSSGTADLDTRELLQTRYYNYSHNR